MRKCYFTIYINYFMRKLFQLEIDGFEQSLQIKNGSKSAIDLVEQAIERIEKLNPSINAVVTKTYEEARDTASKQLP